MWSVFTWTGQGLIELAVAHDKTDAERTRNDYQHHPKISGHVSIAVRTEHRPQVTSG
ncbi:hypothetical protein V2W30_41310 (plasmid) [Streptomyces sp. Q6]|uniref:Uncharacterized protein n=1 Tax=Streptomyces citrinus TaxID=3118173 RepID=A0ACD5AQY8_9ACTN